LVHAVAALVGKELRGGRDRTEVSDYGADREQLVPAGALPGERQVIEHDLSNAHEHLGVQLAVVAPARQLQQGAAVAGLEAERLLESRVQRALLRRGLALLRALRAVEQVQLHVHVHLNEGGVS